MGPDMNLNDVVPDPKADPHPYAKKEGARMPLQVISLDMLSRIAKSIPKTENISTDQITMEGVVFTKITLSKEDSEQGKEETRSVWAFFGVIALDDIHDDDVIKIGTIL